MALSLRINVIPILIQKVAGHVLSPYLHSVATWSVGQPTINSVPAAPLSTFGSSDDPCFSYLCNAKGKTKPMSSAICITQLFGHKKNSNSIDPSGASGAGKSLKMLRLTAGRSASAERVQFGEEVPNGSHGILGEDAIA